VSVVRGGAALTAAGSADGDPPDDVDTLSAGSLKAATANDCGAKYILHEEWLADVCGVSRRRYVTLSPPITCLFLSWISQKLSTDFHDIVEGLATKKKVIRFWWLFGFFC